MSNQNYAKNIQATKPVIFFPLVRNTETAKGVAEGQTPFVIWLAFIYLFFLIVILNQKVAKSQIFSLGNGWFWWRK